MKKAFGAFGLAMLLAVAAIPAQAQTWRGMGRLSGVVLDPDGKPVKGAKVTLLSVRGSNTGPAPIITDAKGKFVAGGLLGGAWNVDVEADGFLPRKMSANVSELERLVPAMEIRLERKPEEKPAPAREAVVVGGVEITPEVAAAIEEANGFMKAGKWKEAAAGYEKALAVLPNNTQLEFALARAYYGGGDLKKAIAQLQKVYQADASNVTAASLLADMLLEDGQLDEAGKVLGALPAGAITDPDTLINLGIRFVNNGKPEEAYKFFDQAVSRDATVAAAYYYRALASLQVKKMDEARADLKKVVELAPDSSEAKEAQELLAQIK